MASPTPSRRELLADGAVSIQRACELSGLSRSTICRRIASGELASTRVGRRRLVPRRALDELLARGLEPRPETR